jgi:hypothetical protein
VRAVKTRRTETPGFEALHAFQFARDIEHLFTEALELGFVMPLGFDAKLVIAAEIAAVVRPIGRMGKRRTRAALFGGGIRFAALRSCPMPSRRWPVRRGRPLLKISLGTRPAMTTTIQITLHGKPQP